METIPASTQPAERQGPRTTGPLTAAATSQPLVKSRTQAEQLLELRLNAAVDLLLAYLLEDSQAVAVMSDAEENASPRTA